MQEIVIKIPEAIIKDAKDSPNYCPSYLFEMIWKAVAKGTVLPKGHGDLKDADNLKHAFIMWNMAVQGNFTDTDIASIVYNSPTIIGADKENAE